MFVFQQLCKRISVLEALQELFQCLVPIGYKFAVCYSTFKYDPRKADTVERMHRNKIVSLYPINIVCFPIPNCEEQNPKWVAPFLRLFEKTESHEIFYKLNDNDPRTKFSMEEKENWVGKRIIIMIRKPFE